MIQDVRLALTTGRQITAIKPIRRQPSFDREDALISTPKERPRNAQGTPKERPKNAQRTPKEREDGDKHFLTAALPQAVKPIDFSFILMTDRLGYSIRHQSKKPMRRGSQRDQDRHQVACV